jgi:trans-2,3-dihydro-3-hydroxyanthranilate isomerase
MERSIYQLDAFTNQPFGGNPAGVVPEAAGLDEKQMQKIAREMSLSETAFVFPPSSREANVRLRFFTPETEVDLCGHATIAAFYLLVKEGFVRLQGDETFLVQETKAGVLPVRIRAIDGRIRQIMMAQTTPEFTSTLTGVEIDTLAQVLGTSRDALGLYSHPYLPIQTVSTGLNDIILPVRSQDLLDALHPDFGALAEFSRAHNAVGVHAFTLGSDVTAICRNFAPAVGIPEEAATGTSSGALAAYLITHNVASAGVPMLFHQGEGMGRPSQIYVEAELTPALRLWVGGEAVMTLKGTIRF